MLSVEETGAGDGDYTPVKATLFSGMFSDGAVVHTEGRIKVRGALSTHFPKVGYSLKLEMTDEFGNRKKNPLSFLDMRVSDSWNLTALYADDLKIRDKVSIDLWQQLMAEEDAYGTEAAFGANMEYVEVLRDGDHLGLYGLFDDMAPELLNLTNTADFWIFLQSIGGVDNAVKNMYYAARFENGAYRLYFVPWDMDMSWADGDFCQRTDAGTG